MHEFTNLQWPETPFGAEQRPFGQHADTLTACVTEWTGEPDAGPLPIAAAMVYLRVRRHGSARLVGDDTLSIGFRAAVIEDTAEIPALFALTDRALTRARRHAVILAGYRLDADLLRMSALSAVPLRGAAGVLSAWANRATKQRRVALMVDTGSEASATGAELDMPLDPVPVSMPDCPACAARLARRALGRCLAVGLTAAVYTGRCRWEGTFRVAETIEREGWDVLSGHPDASGHPDTSTGHADAHAGGRVSDTAGRLVARAGT